MFATASSTIRILLHSPIMSNSESWRERGNHLLQADNQDMDLSERQVKLKMVIIMLFIPHVIVICLPSRQNFDDIELKFALF